MIAQSYISIDTIVEKYIHIILRMINTDQN